MKVGDGVKVIGLMDDKYRGLLGEIRQIKQSDNGPLYQVFFEYNQRIQPIWAADKDLDLVVYNIEEPVNALQ